MLREQRPFKFFNLPATYMKEFVREAKGHGLLYVPIRNKQKSDYIELVVFADDAAKIQRIYDNLGLDYVKFYHWPGEGIKTPGSGKESVRAFLAQQKLFARLNKP